MEFLQITLTGWVAITIAFSMVILSAAMFLIGTERIHYIWGAFCAVVAIWAGGFYMISLADNPDLARFWWKISYIGLILNPPTFFHFAIEFINNGRINRFKKVILSITYSIAAIFLFLNLTTNLVVDEVTILFDNLYYNTPPAVLHPYFTAFFLGLILISFVLVLMEYIKREKGDLFRKKASYFFIATLIGFIGGSMNFLAVYEINMHPTTNLGVAFGAGLIAYSILRYRLFDIRIVVAQLLTLIIVSFAGLRLIVSNDTPEVIFNSSLFLVTLLVGMNLISSVKKELKQREKIEKLVSELQEANQGQTNLLHIVNHQIKGYLSKSRNIFAELLMEKSYEAVNDKSKPMLEEGFNSLTEGVAFVKNFLDAANIDQGTYVYSMNELDFRELVESASGKERSLAENKNLDFKVEIKDGDYKISGDKTQLEQSVRNLIDNSIYYTPSGEVSVSLERKEDKILLAVKDTGVGLSEDLKPKLFTKGARGRDSLKININSTGFGLAFVRGVALAHKGRVWAESEGEGKGSTFYMELPA